MKKLTTFLLATLVTVGFSSCDLYNGITGGVNTSTATASNDPVVVAETSLRVSKDTIDLFLHLEKDNQVVIKAKLPEVHAFAEKCRREVPDLLISANKVKNTYKHNRTPENAASMTTFISTLMQLSTQATQYTVKLNSTTP